MNSLPFSIRTYNPTNNLTPGLGSLTTPKIQIPQSCALKFSESKHSNPNPTLLSRREAVGIGFSFSLLQFLHPRRGAAAEESGAAAAPCDFTAAPSGLAYCDKVIGTGPQPVKGQLIKVINSH